MSRASAAAPPRPAGDAPEAASGFRGFVEPDHPLVATLFPPPAADRRGTLELGLAAARRHLRYRAVRGRRSLTEIHHDLAGGGAPAEANCLSLCCVLASYLRRAGFGPDEALVAVGGVRGHAHFHAWVLARSGGTSWWIDPARLEPETASGADVWSLHTIHTLFNDRRLLVRQEEIRDALLAAGEQAEPRSIVFGPTDADLQGLLADAEVGRAFSRFLADEPCPAGEAPGPTLQAAAGRGLLRLREGRIEPGPGLVVIPARAGADLGERIAPSLARYREIVGDALPRVREAFSSTAAARRFAWGDVVHALAAGALMDLETGRRLARLGEGLEQADDTRVWVFAGPGAENAYGVQCSLDESGAWAVGQLWHTRVERELRVPAPMIGAMARLEAGEEGALDARADLYLRHLRLVERDGAGRRAAIPVFLRDDWSLLSAPVGEAAERLAATAVVPALQSLERSPWWGPRLGELDVRHAAVRLILEHAADEVVKHGILPGFPDAGSAAPSWGRWLWPLAPAADPAGTGTPAGGRAA